MVTQNNIEIVEVDEVEAMDVDLKDEYLKMVSASKSISFDLSQHEELFENIFMDYKEKLIIEVGNPYFMCGKNKLTDFAAVVLELKKVHFLDFVLDEVVLLVLSNYDSPKIITVSSNELGSYKWIDNYLGVKYMYEKDGIEKIKKIIQTMTRYAPLKEEYKYSGWLIGSNCAYVINGQPQYYKKSIENNNEKQYCEFALNMLDVAEHPLTIPLLSVAALSLTQSKMIASGEFFKGVCCVIGQSQSFKTTLATLFYDFESGRKANINFDSSEAAIVRTIGNKRDSVCVVDDLKPAFSKMARNSLTSKLEKIIRLSSDDSNGYQRAGLQNSTIINKSHCITFLTAEELPIEVYSTLARMLVLEMNRKSVNREKLTYFQEKHYIYRAFIENYIHYICNQDVDKYCVNLKQRFLNERNKLRNSLLKKDILVDNRTNDMCVWLYISFDEVLKYGLKVNAITQSQLEDYKKESLEIFLNIMESQAERINELDDISCFFKGLRYLLDTKEERIEQLQTRNRGYSSAESKSAIGFSKKDLVYLKNDIAFQKVLHYYKRFGKDLATTEATLRRLLNDNGYLVAKTPKSPIHRLFVNHESYQCIVFTEKTFNKLLRGGKNYDDERDNELSSDRLANENAKNFL